MHLSVLLFLTLPHKYSKGQERWLFFAFESLGGTTCVVVDFADGVVEAYGDEWYCGEWKPDVKYVPGIPLTNPMEVPHVFQ